MQEDMIEDMTSEEIEKDQYLIFTIAHQQFGFQAMSIQEILPTVNITKVPNSPNYIEGIMNLRGKLSTVINFRKKFEFEEKKCDEDARIVIVEHEDCPIGIIVDSVEEVLKISNDNIQKIPESLGSPVSENHITGVATFGKDRIIMLLDLNAILTKIKTDTSKKSTTV